jgi:hypothetical protein
MILVRVLAQGRWNDVSGRLVMSGKARGERVISLDLPTQDAV